MKTWIVAVAALILGVGISIPALALADNGTPATYGGLQVVTVQADVPLSSSSGMAQAYCPDSSWAATGGGFYVEAAGSNVRAIDNRKLEADDGTGRDFWHVAIFGGSGSGTLYVQVVCTKLG